VPLRLAVLAATLTLLSSCATVDAGIDGGGPGPDGDRQPGCVVPPNEGALLNAYAHDAVLAVIPEGAHPDKPAQRSWGCIHLDLEDVSSTSVSRTFTLDHDYDRVSLAAAYRSALAREGWAGEPAPGPSPDPAGPSEAGLGYCRMVRGVTSSLNIYAQASFRVDVRPSIGARPSEPVWQVTPGTLLVSITADPTRASCRW
jgi:hypothetical protein